MLKRNKNKIIISSLVILGIILILAGSFRGSSSDTDDVYDKYINKLEIKIEDFLKKVDGIKEAEVIITLEEYNPSQSSSDSLFNSDDETTTPLPKVRGVAVACTNGDDYNVQIKVTEIIARYLGISSNRIKIVAKK